MRPHLSGFQIFGCHIYADMMALNKSLQCCLTLYNRMLYICWHLNYIQKFFLFDQIKCPDKYGLTGVVVPKLLKQDPWILPLLRLMRTQMDFLPWPLSRNAGVPTSILNRLSQSLHIIATIF